MNISKESTTTKILEPFVNVIFTNRRQYSGLLYIFLNSFDGFDNSHIYLSQNIKQNFSSKTQLYLDFPNRINDCYRQAFLFLNKLNLLNNVHINVTKSFEIFNYADLSKITGIGLGIEVTDRHEDCRIRVRFDFKDEMYLFYKAAGVSGASHEILSKAFNNKISIGFTYQFNGNYQTDIRLTYDDHKTNTLTRQKVKRMFRGKMRKAVEFSNSFQLSFCSKAYDRLVYLHHPDISSIIELVNVGPYIKHPILLFGYKPSILKALCKEITNGSLNEYDLYYRIK